MLKSKTFNGIAEYKFSSHGVLKKKLQKNNE